MVKSYVGGTVDVVIAQTFRVNAKKHYGDNQSEALEVAMALLNKQIEDGNVPRIRQDVSSYLISEPLDV